MEMSADNEMRPLALVTGAADSLGRELAMQCVRHGLDLVLVDEAPLEEIATQLRALGERVDCVETRIDTHESIHAIATAIDGRGIDALCASAQGQEGSQRTALLDLISRVAQEMSASEAGRILVVSPEDGPGIADYCGALRADLKSSGVTVTCLRMTADTENARLAEMGFEAMLEGDNEVPAPAEVARNASGAAVLLS